jgi:hypothetical protein
MFISLCVAASGGRQPETLHFPRARDLLRPPRAALDGVSANFSRVTANRAPDIATCILKAVFANSYTLPLAIGRLPLRLFFIIVVPCLSE